MHIITIKLSNVFLVRGERRIVVDSGTPAILRGAARHGSAPADIGLILLTHGHIDHFGGAAELRASTDAPIAVHQADLLVLREGRNPASLRSTGLEGQLLRPFLPWRTTPLEPDVTCEDSLTPFGILTRTVHTPGHSAGHSVVPLPDGHLIAGDRSRGGFLGGRLRGRLPNPPYFVTDAAQQAASLQLALSLPAHTRHIGHGGPLAVEHIRARAQRLGLG
jgi:glyoxylase-like metal-dependent hydrolase (beta-lactamase superfamily II)